MPNLKIDLPVGATISDGKQITFKTPCDCSAITALLIDGVAYDLVDALGNVVAGGNSFVADVMVSVIIDTDTNKAFLQNAAIGGNATVEDLGTFGGVPLSTLIDALEDWLETNQGKSTHCRFFASATGVVNAWGGSSVSLSMTLPNTGIIPWSAQVLATLNGGVITQMLLTSTSGIFIATRNNTWQKLYQLCGATGVAAAATKLNTARTITLKGDVTGSVKFDGSANVNIETALATSMPTTPTMNIPMEAWEDYTIEDLGYDMKAVPTGGWDAIQGYRIDLSSLIDEDGYMPSYVQVICPINSQGKELIAVTLAIDENENYIYEGFNREIAIPTIEAPLLHFPSMNPYLFVSGMAVFEDTEVFLENAIIRVWYGGLV